MQRGKLLDDISGFPPWIREGGAGRWSLRLQIGIRELATAARSEARGNGSRHCDARGDEIEMRPGDYLDSAGEEAGRYRLDEPIGQGPHYQLVRCVDTDENRHVVAKAPRIDAETGGAEAARFQAMEREAEILRLGVSGLPPFVDFLEIQVDDGLSVPVLLYEFWPGESLFEYVAKRPREILDAAELLEAVRRVGEILRRLHREERVFRNLDPRHVIVSEEGEVRGLVGTAHVTPVGASPVRPSSDYAGVPYVAPEARQEKSGETMRRTADVYGLAALTSYVLTGEEPLAAVESPLNGRAYELLRRGDRPRLGNLVATGLQPVAKNRVDLETYLDCTALDALPEEEAPLLEEGASIKPLPEPWAGARPPEENRARGSQLSSGPLISVARGDEAAAEGGFPPESTSGDAADGRTAPVREFVGETDRVGRSEEAKSADTDEGGDVRREESGAPAREVDMVDEHLDSDRAPTRRDPEGLPALSELSLRTRLVIGVVVPLVAMLAVVLLGLLGVY